MIPHWLLFMLASLGWSALFITDALKMWHAAVLLATIVVLLAFALPTTRRGGEEELNYSAELLVNINRTYFINPSVCDRGDAGCGFRSKASAIPRVLQGFATTKCAGIAPSLRVAAKTGACSVALPAHIPDMGCAPFLAFIPLLPQRIT